MIRVLLVDGEELVRAGLRLVLAVAEDVDVVAEAHDVCGAVVAAREHEPDVVLLDPKPATNPDGAAAVTRLRQLPCAPAVVVVSTSTDEAHVLATLQAGAQGYLLRSSTASQLTDAVRSVAGGCAVLAPEVTAGVVRRALAAPPAPDPDAVAALSGREQEVLEHLAAGATNGEIAAQLGLGETSVKTYVSRVLSKLGVSNRVQAALVVQQGAPTSAPEGGIPEQDAGGRRSAR